MPESRPESHVITVHIARPLSVVAAFLALPANMNHWASGLGRSLRLEQGEWRADGPEGPVSVRFSPPNAFGVADHWVRVSPGVEVYVPLRAIAHGAGADVQLTLLRQAAMSDEQFMRDIEWVQRDLDALRTLLESGHE